MRIASSLFNELSGFLAASHESRSFPEEELIVELNNR